MGRCRVIEGVLQPVSPTTVEQRLARKNELKTHGNRGNTKTKKVQTTLLKQQYENFTGSSSESLDQIHDKLQKLISQLEILEVSLSQEDINLKFLRSLPSEWRTHTLIWRNKTDLEEQSLNDLFNSLKIYEAEGKSFSSASTSTQNIAFVSTSNTDSTNEPVSAAASVSAVRAKIPVSSLPNVDSLSNAISVDDLEEMNLKWQMAMLTSVTTVTGKDILQRSVGLLKIQEGMVQLSLKGEMFQSRLLHQMLWFPNVMVWEAMIGVFKQKRSLPIMLSWPSHLQVLLLTMRDNALVSLRQHLEKAEQERDDLKLKLEKFQTSSKNLSELLASQTNEKTSLGYNSQVFTRAMFDCDDYLSSGSDESLPPSPIYDRSLDHLIKDCDYHKKKMAQSTARNHAKRGTHKQYAQMKLPNPYRHVVPAAVLTQSKLVPITIVRPVTTVVPKTSVTRPRHDKPVVTKPNSPLRGHINCSPSLKASNFPPKVTTVKASMGNPQHALKDKGVIDSGCLKHMTRNVSYLSDFEELNGGYVTFGGNPKGGKISRKGKIRTGKLDFDDVYFVKELKFNLFGVSQMCDKKNSVLFTDTECLVLSHEFKLLDENQVLLRVPRENNMYIVNLKNIVPSGDLTCLFVKATLDESNLWHRRLGHINFKTINKLVQGNLVRGLPSKVFENDHTCVACKKGKQHRASCKTKPVSSVDQPLYRLHID
nr:ribonuclease H-like domain-containing protein [Tanacetum cinerariifolium]